ncbi:hypothetical protein EVAR_93283_1 [Eumeta japonica]|uniref:Uncharacterized protein n=1 Tax=Eumeta variegata TaxID=151549 RepID=A0A4C1UU25_EUMVA|nr:hypothetical protein EVAR_93283_1 [Eumeta japonica]
MNLEFTMFPFTVKTCNNSVDDYAVNLQLELGKHSAVRAIRNINVMRCDVYDGHQKYECDVDRRSRVTYVGGTRAKSYRAPTAWIEKS